jgi:hypothetical protein
MSARLLVYFAERPARDFVLDEDRGYVLGRDPSADLVIDDERVSRRHACLAAGSGSWRLADLGSKNGTLLDGDPVVGERAVEGESWLSFGGVPARFAPLDAAARERLLAGRRRRRETTQGLARELDPSAGREAVFDRILAALVSLAEADRACLLAVGAAGELEAVRVRSDPTGGARSNARGGMPFRGSRGAIERAIEQRAPVVLADVRADAAVAARPSVIAAGVRALVCVPLVRAGRTLGALYADARRAGSAFTELDLELLGALAEQGALALDALRLAGEIAELAGRGAAARAPAPPAGR